MGTIAAGPEPNRNRIRVCYRSPWLGGLRTSFSNQIYVFLKPADDKSSEVFQLQLCQFRSVEARTSPFFTKIETNILNSNLHKALLILNYIHFDLCPFNKLLHY
jgi:hypothetical protein